MTSLKFYHVKENAYLNDEHELQFKIVDANIKENKEGLLIVKANLKNFSIETSIDNLKDEKTPLDIAATDDIFKRGLPKFTLKQFYADDFKNVTLTLEPYIENLTFTSQII